MYYMELKTQYCKDVNAIKTIMSKSIILKCICKYKPLRITKVKGHTLVDHDLL